MLLASPFSAQKLNQAVKNCLWDCRDSDQPFAALAANLERLKAEGEWNEGELARIETATLTILRAVMGERD